MAKSLQVQLSVRIKINRVGPASYFNGGRVMKGSPLVLFHLRAPFVQCLLPCSCTHDLENQTQCHYPVSLSKAPIKPPCAPRDATDPEVTVAMSKVLSTGTNYRLVSATAIRSAPYMQTSPGKNPSVAIFKARIYFSLILFYKCSSA